MAFKCPLILLCCIIMGLGFSVNGNDVGQEVGVYELKKGDFSAKFSNWGASIISLILPDRNGKLGDIVLGYDSIDTYKNDTSFFGATVGRVANRIGGAQFTLDGIRYNITANEKNNTLHGGKVGFGDLAWKVKEQTSESITFFYHSYDGEEGFPGDLDVSVTYTLEAPYILDVKMSALAINKATPVNLAQHTYWNMGGHDSGDILSDEVQIFASRYTRTDKQAIPTGEIVTVTNTPYDFLQPSSIESKFKQFFTLLSPQRGFDVNYIIDGDNDVLKPAARVFSNKSGRVMELSTNAPGVQFYTGNWIKDAAGKNGYVYQAHAGLCLETQGFPDAVNHPNFPSQIVWPGKTYTHNMVFTFSTVK